MAEAAPDMSVVCIPARNEMERLPGLLRSLAAQRGFGQDHRLRVVIVANNCTDGTVEAVTRAQAAEATSSLAIRLIEAQLAGAEAHVGTARRIALDAGADWLDAEGCPDGILLTTDADAELPADWVAANGAALQGAEIVGGRLVIHPDAEPDPAIAALDTRIERYWAAVRALEDRLDPPPHDPAPRHGDHTGASLALRAGLYRRVGGLPPLPHGEDNALVARVQEAGGRLRHCPRVHVRVSDRAVGRAEGGMASEMVRRQAVVRGASTYSLPAPAHWQELLLRRAGLRQVWTAGEAQAETALLSLGLTAPQIVTIASGCPNDIAFVERTMRVLGARAPAAPHSLLDEALAGFDALLGRDQAA